MEKDNIKEGGYIEYNQLLVNFDQVTGHTSISSTNNYGFQYNFNDIKTYISTGFLTIEDHFDKYYEKLDLKKFGDVLTFLNKAGGWEVVGFSTLNDRYHDQPYGVMYLFKREV